LAYVQPAAARKSFRGFGRLAIRAKRARGGRPLHFQNAVCLLGLQVFYQQHQPARCTLNADLAVLQAGIREERLSACFKLRKRGFQVGGRQFFRANFQQKVSCFGSYFRERGLGGFR